MNRQRVREQVRESRLAQGLSPTVTADRLLDELAAEVLDQAEEIAKEAAA
jgi:hypothetical protein